MPGHAPAVDIAIQYYGKPYQTALTLHSLLRYSSHWIGRIYLTIEKKQPDGESVRLLRSLTGLLEKPVHEHHPIFHIGWGHPIGHLWKSWIPAYRNSFRYQYAWENSQANFLLLLHNDMLFHGDLIAAYLDRINGALAIGQVGQCWNCSAAAAGLCAPDRFQDFQPSGTELRQLYRQFPGTRQSEYARVLKGREYTWPLPECRLNEFAALIDLQQARTIPKAPIFGAFEGLDTGSAWFWHAIRHGYRIQHLDFSPWATHAWATHPHGGKSANTNLELYDHAEAKALELLREGYRGPWKPADELALAARANQFRQ
jgi:hypothetical protein